MSQVSLIADQLLESLALLRQGSVAECFQIKADIQLQIREQDEDNMPCIFEVRITETNDVFRIDNPTAKAICFIATDQCVFSNDLPKRCDCIVFDDETFCFIELKLSVISRRQGTTRAKEAREQLERTIQYFVAEFGRILKNYTFEAYVVMRPTVYPSRSASRDIIFERFQNDLGVRLFEQNWKRF